MNIHLYISKRKNKIIQLEREGMNVNVKEKKYQETCKNIKEKEKHCKNVAS